MLEATMKRNASLFKVPWSFRCCLWFRR